ncbi:MAG: hypothetical protein JWQ02_748 [Capsulimonas sp.]|jgi:hypothetical protein|nr:hypothetical protein [Capsulimonas sp.]
MPDNPYWPKIIYTTPLGACVTALILFAVGGCVIFRAEKVRQYDIKRHIEQTPRLKILLRLHREQLEQYQSNWHLWEIRLGGAATILFGLAILYSVLHH